VRRVWHNVCLARRLTLQFYPQFVRRVWHNVAHSVWHNAAPRVGSKHNIFIVTYSCVLHWSCPPPTPPHSSLSLVIQTFLRLWVELQCQPACQTNWTALCLSHDAASLCWTCPLQTHLHPLRATHSHILPRVRVAGCRRRVEDSRDFGAHPRPSYSWDFGHQS